MGNTAYLAVGKRLGSSGTVDIYSWDPVFFIWNYYQTLPTSFITPYAIKHFTSNNGTYMVVADRDTVNFGFVTPKVFAFNSSSWSLIQQLSAGVNWNVETVTIDNIVYLLQTGFNLGTPQTSYFYRWNNNLQLFDQLSTLINPQSGITAVSSFFVNSIGYFFAGYPSATSFVFQLI